MINPGDLPVSFTVAELGDGVHNFTVVATANGVTVIQTVIVTISSELELVKHEFA